MSNVVTDEFLTHILNRQCFNVHGNLEKIVYEQGAFYSFISKYDADAVALCQQQGYRYINGRAVLEYRGGAKVSKPTIHSIEVNSNELNWEDAYSIAEAISQVSRFSKDPHTHTYAVALYKKWIENSLKRQYATLTLTAKDKNRCMGFITIREAENHNTIDLVGVHQDYQQKGVGTELLAKALEISKEKTVYVGTETENIPAISLYTKLGFRITSYQPVFHKHT